MVAGTVISFLTVIARLMISGLLPELSTADLASGILWSLALPFLGWVVSSVILYAAAKALAGKGSFRTTLRLCGYGLLPWTIFTVVWLFTVLIFFRVPQDTYYSLWEFPPFVNGTLWVIFMVWTGILWVYALKHAHAIPRRKAAAAVIFLAFFAVAAAYLSVWVQILLSLLSSF